MALQDCFGELADISFEPQSRMAEKGESLWKVMHAKA
jgi:hypothetical protein